MALVQTPQNCKLDKEQADGKCHIVKAFIQDQNKEEDNTNKYVKALLASLQTKVNSNKWRYVGMTGCGHYIIDKHFQAQQKPQCKLFPSDNHVLHPGIILCPSPSHQFMDCTLSNGILSTFASAHHNEKVYA